MTPHNLDVAEAAADRDRQWFDRNPERRYRVRGFVPGELPVSLPVRSGVWCVVVIRLGTDARSRARLPVWFERMPPDEDDVLASVVGRLRNGAHTLPSEAVH